MCLLRLLKIVIYIYNLIFLYFVLHTDGHLILNQEMHISVQSSKYSRPLLPLIVFNIQNISSPSQKCISFQSRIKTLS